jgi:hypothetical protein
MTNSGFVVVVTNKLIGKQFYRVSMVVSLLRATFLRDRVASPAQAENCLPVRFAFSLPLPL